MAENQALEGFLRGGDGMPPPPPPEPAQPAAEPPAPATPPAESKAPTAPPAPAAKPAETKPEDDDEPVDHQGLQVPFGALEKARNARNDWKARAAALEERALLLAKQLEEAKRPPPAPPPPAPVMEPMPDFHQDPQGYINHMAVRHQQVILNERLNISEAMLRDKLGPEKVDEYVSAFREQVTRDPTLWGKLYSQPMPYQWLIKEVDRLRLTSEIGDDPSAYRARLLAEERAKWEAERAQSASPPVSPAAGLPPSLANARSVAGRSAPAWTGETSLEDVVQQIRTRRQRR